MADDGVIAHGSWYKRALTPMINNRGRQRAFIIPSIDRAHMERARLDVELSRPIGDGLCDTIQREQMTASAIVRLFGARGPAAVVWLVMAIVIIALNGVLSARDRSHVLKERFKTLTPSVAHANTAPTVTFKSAIGGLIASLTDANPDIPFWRSRQSVRGIAVHEKASAALDVALDQVIDMADRFCRSTRALTQDMMSVMTNAFRGQDLNNRHLAECFSDDAIEHALFTSHYGKSITRLGT